MILSTSSSRAVNIRIGTSDFCRMRRQISIPSMSGSIRSSTIREGCLLWAEASASVPFDAVRTSYPAFLRYSETKDAIEASSSTTSTDWVPLLMTVGLRTRCRQGKCEKEVRNRTVLPSVDGVGAVVLRPRPFQGDPGLAHEREVDPPALDAEGEGPADVAEPNA